MNTAAALTPLTPLTSFAPVVAPRVAPTLEQKARLATVEAWSAPYRSESFAEDLPEWRAPAPVAKPRWRVALLLAVPLGMALVGSVLPIVATVA
jgi:hypothetical protein